MPYQIELTNSEALPTAVVRGRVEPRELSQFVPAACGEVWSFVRSAGLPKPGRHCGFALATELRALAMRFQERLLDQVRRIELALQLLA